jgi:hypothetical protein
MIMKEWAEIPLLQDPYQGPLTPTEQLHALEEALEHAQAAAAGFQGLVAAIITRMAGIRQEMTRADAAPTPAVAHQPRENHVSTEFRGSMRSPAADDA